MPNSALPDHLKGTLHWDYPWPLSYIPRAWTSYKLNGPPTLLCGNQRNFNDGVPDPIPNPLLTGGFAWGLTWPFCIAVSWKYKTRRVHFRFGCRWDSVDFYYTIPSLEISAKIKYEV